MATLGSLVLEMSANVARLSNDLNSARGRVDKFVGGAKKALGGLGVAFGSALTIGGISSLVKSSAQAADALAKMSQKTGLTVETLNGLSLGATKAGSNIKELESGFRRLSANTLDVAKGTGEAKDAFKALGINATDSSGNLRSMDSLLLEIADKFSTMEDGTTKAALAQDIFGKSGANLIPLLNAGSASLKGLTDEALSYGGVTTATAKQAEIFNDNISDLQRISQGLGNALLKGAVPTLIKLTQSLKDSGAGAEGFTKIAERVSAAMKVLSTGASVTSTVFNALGTNLGAVAAAVVQAVKGNFSTAFDILRDRSSTLVDDLGTGVDKIKAIWTDASTDVPAKTKLVGDGIKTLPPILNDVVEVTNKATSGIQRQIEGLQLQAATYGLSEKAATLYKLSLDGATESQLAQANASLTLIERLEAEEELRQKALQSAAARGKAFADEVMAKKAAAQELVQAQQDAAKAFRDTIESTLGSEILNVMQGNFDNIGSSFQGLLDRMVSDFLSSQLLDLISGVGGSIGGLGGSGGGLGSVLGSLFGGGRAIGGAVSGGQAYMVGEHGPELFVPPGAGGSIVPNGSSKGSIIVNNHFVIQAPNGRVSPDTQQQIAARTGQTVNRALSRSR